jgi:hypothetical protein
LSRNVILQESEIGRLCSSSDLNKAAYLLGVMTPDMAVIYYYEAGGKEYRLSHNWNFQQEIMSNALTDDEKCLAWGVAAHLIEDNIAHTSMVPDAIERLRTPNWVLHPLLEKKVDSALVMKYPELKETTPHIMDALDGEKSDRYVAMIEAAMGDNSQINVREELAKLKLAVSGGNFYESQFKPTGSTWIFTSYNYIDVFTNWLAPYIGTINFANTDYYLTKTEEQLTNVFNNWGTRYQLSPHGFEELGASNQKASSSLTIFLVLAVGLPITLTIFTRKKRFNYLYLLLIPVLIIDIFFLSFWSDILFFAAIDIFFFAIYPFLKWRIQNIHLKSSKMKILKFFM